MVLQLQKPLLYTETLAEPVKIPQTTRKNYIENRVSVLIRYYFLLCF